MKLYRFLFIAVICIVAIAWLPNALSFKKSFTRGRIDAPVREETTFPNLKTKLKANEAKTFVSKKGYNEETCFLIDMTMPSGSNRFFIYDFKKDTITNTGLVTHGNCFQEWLEGRKYSNVVGSGCTSLGKYRIGMPYTGKWGYSYKLHGLDSTNKNAFERTVVLHSHSCVSETETSDEICQSNGCPTVSPNFLLKLKAIINSSKKPVLLWIYE